MKILKEFHQLAVIHAVEKLFKIKNSPRFTTALKIRRFFLQTIKENETWDVEFE